MLYRAIIGGVGAARRDWSEHAIGRGSAWALDGLWMGFGRALDGLWMGPESKRGPDPWDSRGGSRAAAGVCMISNFRCPYGPVFT